MTDILNMNGRIISFKVNDFLITVDNKRIPFVFKFVDNLMMFN